MPTVSTWRGGVRVRGEAYGGGPQGAFRGNGREKYPLVLVLFCCSRATIYLSVLFSCLVSGGGAVYRMYHTIPYVVVGRRRSRRDHDLARSSSRQTSRQRKRVPRGEAMDIGWLSSDTFCGAKLCRCSTYIPTCSGNSWLATTPSFHLLFLYSSSRRTGFSSVKGRSYPCVQNHEAPQFR